jgi:hypothetical protein
MEYGNDGIMVLEYWVNVFFVKPFLIKELINGNFPLISTFQYSTIPLFPTQGKY